MRNQVVLVGDTPVKDGMLALQDETHLVSLRSAELEDGEGLTRILIAPWGEVESTRGNFVVDEEALAATIAQFRRHGTDLPIDFEHQTLGGPFSSPDGLAPAAGWIKDLIGVEAVGLMAEVQWTELGLEHLRRRQYRYLSPVAIVRKSDRRMTGLHSAALTNKPAIVGMEAIVNRQEGDGSVERVVQDEKSNQKCKSARAEARGSLGIRLEEHSMMASLEELRRQLNLDQQDGARQVLIAASARIAELEQHRERKKAEERVAEAMARGKLTEAQHDWALRLALKDAASFDEWLASAPVVVRLGKTAAPDEGDEIARSHQAIAARARSEYRTDSLVQALTSEEAYVQHALREAETSKQ